MPYYLNNIVYTHLYFISKDKKSFFNNLLLL